LDTVPPASSTVRPKPRQRLQAQTSHRADSGRRHADRFCHDASGTSVRRAIAIRSSTGTGVLRLLGLGLAVVVGAKLASLWQLLAAPLPIEVFNGVLRKRVRELFFHDAQRT